MYEDASVELNIRFVSIQHYFFPATVSPHRISYLTNFSSSSPYDTNAMGFLENYLYWQDTKADGTKRSLFAKVRPYQPLYV